MKTIKQLVWGIVGSATVVLTGCSTVVENTRKASDWMWHCEANNETGEWDCQSVQVGSKPLTRLQPSAEDVVVEISEQVPTVVNSPLPEVDTVDPDVAEPRVAEPAIDKPVQPESVATEQVAPESAPSVRGHKVQGVSGYVVQLAVVRNEQAVQQFMDEHNLDQDSLTYHYIFSGDQYWYAVISSPYRTRTDAVRAVVALEQSHPDLVPWIRSAQSFQQAIDAAS